MWAAVAMQQSPENFWYETGAKQSNQWAELHIVLLVLITETIPAHFYINRPCIKV